jgi:outer membrane protein, heavy metal efflux system
LNSLPESRESEFGRRRTLGGAVLVVVISLPAAWGCRADCHYVPSARRLPVYMQDLAEEVPVATPPPPPAPAPEEREPDNEHPPGDDQNSASRSIVIPTAASPTQEFAAGRASVFGGPAGNRSSGVRAAPSTRSGGARVAKKAATSPAHHTRQKQPAIAQAGLFEPAETAPEAQSATQPEAAAQPSQSPQLDVEPAPLPADDLPGELRRERLRRGFLQWDPDVVDPTAGVTLNQAVAEALAANPAIQATAEDIREAAAEWVTESLLPNPTLSVVGSMVPFPGQRFTPDREGGPPQFDLWASYPIDWWLFGKRLAAMEAAQRGIEVTGAETADLIREQVVETITTYFDALEARSLVDLALLDVENLERVEELTERLVDLGAAGRIELERIRLEVLASRRELRETLVEYTTAKAQLRSLMGRLGPEREFLLAGSLDVVDPVAPIDEEAAFELAMLHRPDLAARQRDLARASADIRMEQVNAKPEVNLEAGYTRQFQRRVLEMPDAHTWGVGLEMTLPIYDRNQGNILRAQADYRRAQWEYRTAVLELQAEIETAVESYRQAHAIITTEAPAQFEAARRVQEAFESAYERGDRSFLEILDAQRTFRETMRLYINGQAGYWRALYDLNAAIGQRVLD